VKEILTKEHLHAIFKQFDTDSSGFITVENISEAMQKFGIHISKEEIQDIMKKHAVTDQTQINF
jgi:Ca2+-binding EF-hand superfamily protein